MFLRRLPSRIAAVSLAVLSAGVGLPAHAMRNGDATQRPIDIVQSSTAAEPAPAISVAYETQVAIGIVNTGRKTLGIARDWGSLRAIVPAGSHIEMSGQRFRLLQFHFNTPTEPTAALSPAEIVVHFVHVREGAGVCDRDALLVVGARIREGEAHSELGKIASIADALPVDQNEAVTIRDFRLDSVLPSIKTGWRYPGTATAPSTCRVDNPAQALLEQVSTDIFPESVAWVVLQEPIRMSRAQIEKVRDQLDRDVLANRRPADPRASHSGD